MKKWTLAVILVLAAAALAGVYFIVSGSTRNEQKDAEGGVLFDFSAEDIESITTHGGVTVSISDNGARITSPEGYDADETAVKRLTGCIAGLRYLKELPSENPSAYGIDGGKLTFALKNGGSGEILTGDYTETGDGFAVSVDGRIYKIRPADGQVLSYGLNDLRSKDVFKGVEDVETLTIRRRGEEPLRIETDGLVGWKITSPVICGADTQVIDDVLKSLLSLKAESFEDNFPEDDFEEDLTIEFCDGEANYSLSASKGNGGAYYARTGKDGDIFTADISSLGITDMPLKEFTNSYVASYNISKVERIQEYIDGKLFDFEIDAGSADKSQDSFKLNGRDANQVNGDGEQLFRLHYLALITVRIGEIVPREPEDNELGDIEFSVAYKFKGMDQPIIYSYVGFGEDKLCVYMNELYTGIAVDKDCLDEEGGVKETLSELCRAIAE